MQAIADRQQPMNVSLSDGDIKELITWRRHKVERSGSRYTVLINGRNMPRHCRGKQCIMHCLGCIVLYSRR